MATNVEHPIYLSNTEIDYKKEKKTLEISVKIFADDLQKVLSDKKKELVEVGTEKEHPQATAYIMEYLKANLKFKADGRKLDYTYVGRQAGDKSDLFAMYIFIEIKKVDAFKVLEVENNILIDYYPTQLNFISSHTSKGLNKVLAKKGETRQSIKW